MMNYIDRFFICLTIPVLLVWSLLDHACINFFMCSWLQVLNMFIEYFVSRYVRKYPLGCNSLFLLKGWLWPHKMECFCCWFPAFIHGGLIGHRGYFNVLISVETYFLTMYMGSFSECSLRCWEQSIFFCVCVNRSIDISVGPFSFIAAAPCFFWFFFFGGQGILGIASISLGFIGLLKFFFVLIQLW